MRRYFHPCAFMAIYFTSMLCCMGVAAAEGQTRVISQTLPAEERRARVAERREQDSTPPVDLQTRVDRLVQPLIENELLYGLCIGVVDGEKTYVFSYGRVSSKSTGKP